MYKARCRKTNEIVALKKVLTENEKEGVILFFYEIKKFHRWMDYFLILVSYNSFARNQNTSSFKTRQYSEIN